MPLVRFVLCLTMSLVVTAGVASAQVVTFEDLTLPPSGYFNGDPGNLSPGQSISTPWTSGGASFSNNYGIDEYQGVLYPYWGGFAASNQSAVVSGTAFGDFADQYLAFPGGGFSSPTYAIAYTDGATVTLPITAAVSGFRIANTAYAALTILNGDEYGFSTPLGLGGWFATTATGKLGATVTGSATYYLADFRTGTSPGLLASWDWFDLSSLGEVDTIEFSFAGSDVNSAGLVTPAYFAMDNLTFAAVPEPSVMVAGVCGLAAGLIARWRHRRIAG
ncbi:MAG: DUF4465 domain-containing protein [Pirellulales bacterium]